jgi:hypothetical protein
LFNKNHYSTMYIYLKYSIYKKNMRLAAICIKYYTADHPPLTLLAVVSELRRNHCEQTNDFLSSMREDHVMGSR